MKLLAILLSFIGTFLSVSGTVKVDLQTHAFIDENRRTLIFHGVNAVYKVAPWHPATTGFDSTSTLSEMDAQNLKNWGFNIVRLGVMWPGVEPTTRGNYNQTYLQQIETIVNTLQKNDLYVILDFHQDLWHRAFCGEGVPDYVYQICKNNEPEGTRPFPLPKVNTTYPLDANGYPTLDACLSQMFAAYYLTDEVGAGFQCLYDNIENLWDAFAGYWKTVATRFSSYSNVLGYELINEPWAGNVFDSPKNLLPQYAERHFLQPMYQYLHQEIRKIDNEKIIFFEGLTIDYWPSGFDSAPGTAEYNDRQALAYHIYCPTDGSSKKLLFACNVIDDLFFTMRKKDIERLGVGMIMTEFGASEDIKTDLYLLNKLANLADHFQQSWMYWQFKYYEDLTTCTPQGESLYNDDGKVCQDKINVLSRTYPQATAGIIHRYNYNIESKIFRFTYTPWNTQIFSNITTKNTIAKTTEIYVNQDESYSNGFHVKLQIAGKDIDESNQVITYSCPTFKQKNILQIIQNVGIDLNNDAEEFVEVTISPCVKYIPGVCSCK